MIMTKLAHKSTRVTISGTCFSGGEIWSTGFWLGQEGADAADVTPTMVSAIGAMWQTFFTGASNGVNYRYLTTQVKAARMGLDGKTELDQVEYWTPSGTVAGGETGVPHPPQVTLAATLTSSNVRGPASKGRMFLPGVHIAVGADGRADSGALGTCATAFNTFLSQVNGSVDVPNWLILVSTESLIPLRDSQNKRVEHVKFGNVFDTQRRRRNAISEIYINRDVAQT
jgi:hypothetical protein